MKQFAVKFVARPAMVTARAVKRFAIRAFYVIGLLIYLAIAAGRSDRQHV